VIIVGTHCDVVQKTQPAGWVDQLGQMVERRYMPSSEPDKFGLPRVLGHVEVSCRGRIIGRSLRSLADFIFNVAVDEHLPGNIPVACTHINSSMVITKLLHFIFLSTCVSLLQSAVVAMSLVFVAFIAACAFKVNTMLMA